MTVSAPPLWLCADLSHPNAATLPARLEAALALGPATVWVRRPDALPGPERLPWLRAVRALCSRRGAALWVADRLDLAACVGADGIHLTSGSVSVEDARRWATAVGEPRGVSVTLHAHDAAARALGADYALASPFGAVEGKGAALGPEGLAAMVDRARPSAVIALGGIRGPAEVAACLDAGAVGVAVRGVWLDTAEVASVLGPLHAALARRR